METRKYLFWLIVMTLKGIKMKILIMNRINFIRALEDVTPLLARNGKDAFKKDGRQRYAWKKYRSNALG